MCCLCAYYALNIRNWGRGGKQSLIDRRGGRQQLMQSGGPMFSFVNFAKMHGSSRACEPYHTRACVHAPIEGHKLFPTASSVTIAAVMTACWRACSKSGNDDTGERKAVASSASTAPPGQEQAASITRPHHTHAPPRSCALTARSPSTRESRVLRFARDSNVLFEFFVTGFQQ